MRKNQKAPGGGGFGKVGVPNEIRTRVTCVKGGCPRPLDDGDAPEDGTFKRLQTENQGLGESFLSGARLPSAIPPLPAIVNRQVAVFSGTFIS